MPTRYNIVHVRRHFANEVPNASLGHWDVARLLFLSFQSLGLPATLSVNQFSYGALNVIVGYERLPENALPPGARYVVYQLEQLGEGGHSVHPEMFRIMRQAQAVWDYSPANLPVLAREGIPGRLLPFGFHEGLATIPEQEEDIDVLFYGSQNPRREKILAALRERCALVNLFGIYGEERDTWIARSRVILNMHYYDSAVAEQARVSYLLNNRRCVVTEVAQGDPFADLCRSVPYEQLVEACLELVRDGALRRRMKTDAWEAFSRRPMTDYLRQVL